MTPAKNSRAELDLEWLIESGDSAMGLRAQAYDPSPGGGWDAERIERAHAGHFDFHHRARLKRHATIAAAFAALPPSGKSIAIAAFTSHPWPAPLRVHAGRAGERGSLAGVILMSAEASALFMERHKGKPPEGGVELAEWLGAQAGKPGGDKMMRPLAKAARLVLDAEVIAPYVAALERERAAEKARGDWFTKEVMR